MRRLYSLAALLMALGVACGALGAHLLRDLLPAHDIQIWEKAVFYHLIHALAVLLILGTSNSIISARMASRISILIVVGILLFSGSLYGLVLTNTRWLGMITPLGGSCFIIAWAMLGCAVICPCSKGCGENNKN